MGMLLDRILRGINVTGELVAGAALTFMALGISYEVVARYFFNSPTRWAMETSGFALQVAGFMAAGYVLDRERHVRMDLVTSAVRERVRNGMFLLAYPLGFLFSVLFTYESWLMMKLSLDHSFKSPVMKIPLFLPQLALPLGGLLLCIAFAHRWFSILAWFRGKGEAFPGREGH